MNPKYTSNRSGQHGETWTKTVLDETRQYGDVTGQTAAAAKSRSKPMRKKKGAGGEYDQQTPTMAQFINVGILPT